MRAVSRAGVLCGRELNRLAQTPMKKARRMSRKLFNVGTADVVVLPSQISMA